MNHSARSQTVFPHVRQLFLKTEKSLQHPGVFSQKTSGENTGCSAFSLEMSLPIRFQADNESSVNRELRRAKGSSFRICVELFWIREALKKDGKGDSRGVNRLALELRPQARGSLTKYSPRRLRTCGKLRDAR